MTRQPQCVCWPALLLVQIVSAAFYCSSKARAQTATHPPVPFGTVLHPVSITGTGGNVIGAAGFLAGTNNITLTYAPGGPAPTVVVDYGVAVTGQPVFAVVQASTAPVLSAAFSETSQYLSPNGDGNSVLDGGGLENAYRTVLHIVTGAGTIADALVQGSERFELITLTTPGSVTLSEVGIRSVAFSPPATGNVGSFRSSDANLNAIWELGARTLRNVSFGTGTLPDAWTATADGTDMQPGAGLLLLQNAAATTNYTVSFDVQVVRNEAAWLLRGSIPIRLTGASDILGPPNHLIVGKLPGSLALPLGFNTTLALGALPFPINPGEWHHVSTTIAGPLLTISIDGNSSLFAPITIPCINLIGLVGVSGVAQFGFVNSQDSETRIRNFAITPLGGTAASFAMTSAADVAQFGGLTNAVPVILDGAKRDRLVWSGDLAASGRSTYYSSGVSALVKGSLSLFGQHQLANGEVSSVLPPQIGGGTTVGPDGSITSPFWSLSYSAWFVINLADYYRYTGDLAFVQAEWPVVVRELAYLDSQRDGSGLVQTNIANGFDWHPADLQSLIGGVAEYNVLDARAHSQGALLATAVGATSQAASWTTQAKSDATAINASFYDDLTGLFDISSFIRGIPAEDVNVLASLWGIASPARALSILSRVEQTLGSTKGVAAFPAFSGFSNVISPFINGFDVDARFATGDATGALGLIRRTWGNMLPGSAYYTGAAFEVLGTDGNPVASGQTSLSHGWSTEPTAALSQYVLGVAPITPGFASFAVAPQFGDLAWATGTVATPHGPIGVSWSRQGNSVALNVTVPANTTATVCVPSNGAPLAIVNGQSVAATIGSGFGARSLVIESLPAGHYTMQFPN